MRAIHVLQQMGIAALVSLALAIVPAIAGLAYLLWPSESKLMLMRPLSLTGLFAGLSGFVVGLINGLAHAADSGTTLVSGPVLVGFAESLVPLFAAFSSLSLGWMLVAAGMRRTSA